MMNWATKLGMGCVCLAWTSCWDQTAGTAGVGNPEVVAKVRMGFAPEGFLARTAALAELSFVDAAGRSFEVTQAHAHVHSLEIEPMDGRLGETEIGPFVVDLVTGAFDPNLPLMTMSKGWYRGVEVKLEKSDEKDPSVPASLRGASLALEGQLATGRPFKLILAMDEEWRLSGDSLWLEGQVDLDLQLKLTGAGAHWTPGLCAEPDTGVWVMDQRQSGVCAEAAKAFGESLKNNTQWRKR
jgi:hypothetical protein